MDSHYQESEVDVIARELVSSFAPQSDRATVVGLSGDLGAGKTTLVQSLAKTLGVTETVVSPTFVIAKFYGADAPWERLIHIDAYRIEDPKELEVLGWKNMVESPDTLIVVEWPERIEGILPETTRHYTIEHRENKRRIVKK